MMSQNNNTNRSYAKFQAKEKLLSLLVKNHGSTTNADVLVAIEELTKFNSTSRAPARDDAQLKGNWVMLSSPSFPGRIKPVSEFDESVFKYTLGIVRLFFFSLYIYLHLTYAMYIYLNTHLCMLYCYIYIHVCV